MDPRWSTTSNSDFTWPRLTKRRQIVDRDRCEYDEQQRCESAHCSSQTIQQLGEAETLPKTHSPKHCFKPDFRPISNLGPRKFISSDLSKDVNEYEKAKEAARMDSVRTRPRVYLCPQISLDDMQANDRDTACSILYLSSTKIGQLTSGIPQCSSDLDQVSLPSKPFADPIKCRRQPLHKPLNPDKNWRKVSIEWDAAQKRIFGGRSAD